MVMVKIIPINGKLKAFHIFPNRQRIDIAKPARIQIAGACVMQRVAAPPAIIGGQREHPDCSAGPVIGAAIAEERLVTAIMLNDEESQQQHP